MLKMVGYCDEIHILKMNINYVYIIKYFIYLKVKKYF